MDDPEPGGVSARDRVHAYSPFLKIGAQFTTLVTIHAEGNGVAVGTLRIGGLGVDPVLLHPQGSVGPGGAEHGLLDALFLVTIQTDRSFGNNTDGPRCVTPIAPGDLVPVVDDVGKTHSHCLGRHQNRCRSQDQNESF